jgi:hypothetical protein
MMHMKRRERKPPHMLPRAETPMREEGYSEMDVGLVHELQACLPRLTIVTPKLPTYRESIKRWSEAAEKEAVRVPDKSRSGHLTLVRN